MKKSWPFYLLLSASLIFFLASDARALTISPPIKEIGADPGGDASGIIKLYNESKEEVTVFGSASNFSAKENSDGEPEFTDLDKDGPASDLASWISLPSGAITIKPLDWQNVIYNIKVPKDAEPGGHYAAIFFSPNKSRMENGVSVDYKTGSLLLLTVSGDIKQNGTIKDFSLKDNKHLYDSVPVYLELVVENNGNLHFRPGGGVTIKNIFDRTVGDLPVLKSETGGNVLPKSTRRYEIAWGDEDQNNPASNFWEKVRYEARNFHLGRYTATALVSFPQGQEDPISVSFWIVPWQLIIMVIAGIIILWLIMRTYNRWIIRQARKAR